MGWIEDLVLGLLAAALMVVGGWMVWEFVGFGVTYVL